MKKILMLISLFIIFSCKNKTLRDNDNTIKSDSIVNTVQVDVPREVTKSKQVIFNDSIIYHLLPLLPLSTFVDDSITIKDIFKSPPLL